MRRFGHVKHNYNNKILLIFVVLLFAGLLIPFGISAFAGQTLYGDNSKNVYFAKNNALDMSINNGILDINEELSNNVKNAKSVEFEKHFRIRDDLNTSQSYEVKSIDNNIGNNNETGTFADLQQDINNAHGGILKLIKDYAAIDGDKSISISNNIAIDLNGHKIDALGKTGTIFIVDEKIEFTINDSSNNHGIITGGKGYFDNEFVYGGAIVNAGTLTINGGMFTKNSAKDFGGAIYNKNTLNIYGGVFTENFASIGGAIYNSEEKITPSITTITGSTIINNSATTSGGAFHNKGETRIGGSAILKDNIINGNTNNLQIESGKLILASSPFVEGANIGITAELGVIIDSGATEDTLKYLNSDDESKMMIYKEGAIELIKNELYFVKKEAIQEIDKAAEGSVSKLVKIEVEKAKQHINESKTIQDVNTAKDAGLKDISKAISVINDAIKAIENSIGANPSSKIKEAAEFAINAINNAESYNDVEKAKNEGLSNIDKIKKEEAKPGDNVNNLVNSSTSSSPQTDDNLITYVYYLFILTVLSGFIFVVNRRKLQFTES